MLYIAGYTFFSRKYILNLQVVSWFLYFLSSNFTKYWHLTQWTTYTTTPHLNSWFSFISKKKKTCHEQNNSNKIEWCFYQEHIASRWWLGSNPNIHANRQKKRRSFLRQQRQLAMLHDTTWEKMEFLVKPSQQIF